jgi:hypothetical protein
VSAFDLRHCYSVKVTSNTIDTVSFDVIAAGSLVGSSW